MSKWYVEVLFSNGDVISTWINGTKALVEAYYAPGKVFNLGNVGDNMQTVERIIELEPVE